MKKRKVPARKAPRTAREPKRIPRVTLIGREMDPDRWADLLAECLAALAGPGAATEPPGRFP